MMATDMGRSGVTEKAERIVVEAARWHNRPIRLRCLWVKDTLFRKIAELRLIESAGLHETHFGEPTEDEGMRPERPRFETEDEIDCEARECRQGLTLSENLRGRGDGHRD